MSKRKIGVVLGVVFVFLIVFGLFFYITRPCTKFVSGMLFSDKYFSLIRAYACMGEQINTDIEENTVGFPVSFVDKRGLMHKYQAEIGGITHDGTKIRPSLCVDNGKENQCSFVEVSKISELLNGDKVLVEVIYKDSAPWNNSDIVLNNSVFFEKLKDAIISGSEFPKQPSGVKLRVWQVTVYE